MNTRRLLLNWTFMGSALFALGLPAAQASLILTLQSGADTVSVQDNGAGDLLPSLGGITLAGVTVGNFNILNVTTGESIPLLGTATAPEMDLNSVNQSSGSGTLTITLADTGFLPKSSSRTFLATVGGTTEGTTNFQYYVDFTNKGNLLGAHQLLADLGTFTPGAFSGSHYSTYAFNSNDPYALVMVATINHTGAAVSSFNSNLNDIPEPATLSLFGLGLAGLAGSVRRRRSRG